MDRIQMKSGRLLLLVVSLNLAVPPVANLLATSLSGVAESSEASFWVWLSCLGMGVVASIVLGVAWLYFTLLALGGHKSRLCAVGLVMNVVAVSWSFSLLSPFH